MIKHAARKLVLASTLLARAVHAGGAFAQSVTNPTGTDPEPQGTIVVILLQLLHLA